MIARRSADGGETAAEQNLAVGLHRDARDKTVRTGIKARIQRAIGVQPRDVIARLAEHRAELTPDDDLAIGLYRANKYSVVNIEVKRIDITGCGICTGQISNEAQQQGDEA